MQAPTHILTGVAIQKAFDRVKNRPLALFFIAVLAFLSHGILDKCNILFYHMPKADWQSVVWVGYHFGFLLPATLFFFYKFWRKYKWGIMFSILPDFDWVFKYGQEILGIKPFYNDTYLHNFLHSILDTPLGFLDALPDLRYNPYAALFEIVIIIFFYIFLTRKDILKRV